MANKNRKPADGSAPPKDENVRATNHNKAPQKRSAPKKGRAKSRSLWRYVHVIYILLFFIFWYWLEHYAAKTGKSPLWDLLSHEFFPFISFIITLVCTCLSPLSDKKRKEFFARITRPNRMDPWQHVFILAKAVWKRYFKQNTLLFIVSRILLILYVPAFAANQGLAYKMLDPLSAGVSPVETTLDETLAEISLPVSETSETGSTTTEENEPAPKEEPFPSVSEKELGPLDERLILQSEMPYDISEGELDQIFFRTGEHAITNWSDQDHVQATMENFVLDRHKLRRNPNPDESIENAREYLDDADNASREEALMLDSERPTSNQLQYVIDTRVVVYDSLPFYDLAILTRESFCMWGDAIRSQNGSPEDATTLFAKSILYGFEVLQYDKTTATLSDNLRILSERYEKLAYSLPPDSDERQHAFSLAEIFQILRTKLL